MIAKVVWHVVGGMPFMYVLSDLPERPGPNPFCMSPIRSPSPSFIIGVA